MSKNKNKFSGGRNNFGGNGSMMGQMQSLEKAFASMQQMAAGKVVKESSGGGVVSATMSGDLNLKKIEIDINSMFNLEEKVSQETIYMFEQKITDAINRSFAQVGNTAGKDASAVASQMWSNPNAMANNGKLQEQIKKMQDELENTQLDVPSEDGEVVVTITGKLRLKDIKIVNLLKLLNVNQEGLIDEEDIEMLQDLIVAAVNKAFEKAENIMNEQIYGLLGKRV